MAKKKKNNHKILYTCLVVLLLGLVISIGIYALLKKYSVEEVLYTPECTKKGNVCSVSDIENGVKVSYKVSDKETYNFYVINNDENTMTLLMDENISENIDWETENVNIKGPITALKELNNLTSSWNYVEKLDNYKYDDYGKKRYLSTCEDGTVEPSYDCTTENYATRGYNNIEVVKGYLKVNYNLPEDTITDETVLYTSMDEVRARLITIEEISDIIINYNKPKWLIDNLEENTGYWTLSSSTALNVNYSFGAYALANNNGEVSIESIQTKNAKNDMVMGIRPVIKVNKV